MKPALSEGYFFSVPPPPPDPSVSLLLTLGSRKGSYDASQPCPEGRRNMAKVALDRGSGKAAITVVLRDECPEVPADLWFKVRH